MRVLFDTSALFKRYSVERGSEHVGAICERATEVVVAPHCKVEIASALLRQRHDGMVGVQRCAELMAEVHRDFAEFHCVALDGQVESLAIAAMERGRLRAMDALHIATAQAARAALFVTADRRQALVAQAVGLNAEVVEA